MVDTDKEIRIKTGVLKRCLKEKIMYENEYTALKEKLVEYKQEGKDAYFIKNQEDILKESAAMIPDSLKRLTAAYEDLKKYIPDVPHSDNSQLYKTAADVLKEATPYISINN